MLATLLLATLLATSGGSWARDYQGGLEAVRTLVADERTDPTDRDNVKDRYARFMSAAATLAEAGYREKVNQLIPRDEADALGELIDKGKLQSAAQQLHGMILELAAIVPPESVSTNLEEAPRYATARVTTAPPPERRGGGGGGGQLDELSRLVSEERADPTSAGNVEARLQSLIRTIQGLASGGYREQIGRVFPKQQAEEVRRMISGGRAGQAAGEVSRAILKLGDELVGGAPAEPAVPREESPPPRPERSARPERGGDDGGVSQRPPSGEYAAELKELTGQERRDPTTASNVASRFRQLVLVIQSLAAAGRAEELRDIFPKDDAAEVQKMIDRGDDGPAAKRVHRAIEGLEELAAPAAVESEVKSSPSSKEINFQQLANGRGRHNILKLFNPAIDPERRVMYVVGSKTTAVGVIDLNRDELVDTFDIGVMGGFLAFKQGTLYMFDFEGDKLYEIDVRSKQAKAISIDLVDSIIPRDKEKRKQWQGYEFRMTGYRQFGDGSSGFPTDWRQELNAAYGVIDVERRGKKIGEILTGPDALYYEIDQRTGKLYTTNTGDGSVGVYDLTLLDRTGYCKNNACKIKEIDVGTSADQVLVDGRDNIYVRNRLGGSTIYRYDPRVRRMFVIQNEEHSPGGISLWPTAMELSRNEDKLFVLSHYQAAIDVVDAQTGRLLDSIPFATDLKPRTDSISTLAINHANNRLYAAWPELGLIMAADGERNRETGRIDLQDYGFDRQAAANRGPGLIHLAVDEANGNLYVYLRDQQKLLVFDERKLRLIREKTIDSGKRRETALLVNPERGEVYLGNQVLDSQTLEELATLKGQRVIAYDRDTVYLTKTTSDDKKQRRREVVFEVVNGKVTNKWRLDEIGSIPSRFFLDARRKQLYVAYFTAGTVKVYDLR